MRYRTLDRLLLTGLVIAGSALAAATLAGLAGARLNRTDSMPVGLYWVSPKSPREVGVGDIVMWCPPPVGLFLEARARGYLSVGDCPGQLSKMFKRVFAVAGDSVSIGPSGVRVNDTLIPHSTPLVSDGAGRALVPYAAHFTLARHEVLLLSNSNPRSFDGRYFGPVDAAQLTEVVVPVLTRN